MKIDRLQKVMAQFVHGQESQLPLQDNLWACMWDFISSFSKCFISSFSNVARICFPVPKNSAWQAFCSVFSGAFLPNGFCKYSCMHCSIQFLLLSIEVPARLKAKCKWRREFFAQVLLTGQLYHRLGTSLYSDADICSCVLQKGQRFDRIIPLLHLWYC